MNQLYDDSHVSSAQKSILHCIRMLAPYQRVDTDSLYHFSREDMAEGEKEFYQFIKEMYMDMYENPAKYYIPTAPYDEYMKTAQRRKGIEKVHFNDGKECNLRNTFQQSIGFYPDFFYEAGLHAKEIRNSDYSLVISSKDFDEVKYLLEKPHLRKDNLNRYDAIHSMGIDIDQSSDIYYIMSKKYPKMFLGLWVLCNAPDGIYKYMNYLRLDYKGFYRPMPDMDNIKATLSEEHIRVITSIQNELSNMRLKLKVKPLRNITSGFRWKVEYSLNSKGIFGFYAEPGYLMLCIYFNDFKNINELSKKLSQSDAELFKWFSEKFPERLCKCPNNRCVNFEGNKRRICGLTCRAEISNPDNKDVENSIRILRLFRHI